ncbi:MAG: hypothetical protein DLM56_12635 [Pseudonocardiales bacterium]|nr:MAG: hypothetical protein DLM56_12635 [Pseudonocardiales bacterium]
MIVLLGGGVAWWYGFRGPSDQGAVRAYVRSVCTTVGGWQARLRGLHTGLRSQLSGDHGPKADKAAAVTYFDTALRRTTTMVTRVSNLHAPDVAGASSYQSRVVQATTAARTWFDTQDGVANSLDPSALATFTVTLAGLTRTAAQPLPEVATAVTSDPGSVRLHQAIIAAPACQVLRSSAS